MKAKLIMTAITILCLTSVVNAENLKEKFEYARRQQFEYDHQTKWIPVYEHVVRAGMRSQGFSTSGVSLRYLVEDTFTYIADTQVVCQTENGYLFELTDRYLIGQSLSSDFAKKVFSKHMFCVSMPNSVGTAKQDYLNGSELRDQNNFIRDVRIAIQSTGFNPNEFSIPSDYASRMAIRQSDLYTLGKDGLYVESPNAICKIQSGVYEIQAECAKQPK